MSEAMIREVRAEDVGALSSLWLRVFGDSPEFVARFFELLPELGTGAAAFEGERLLGAAYLLTAQELVEAGRSRRCGYLYAVAVEEAARGRGLGGALCRAAAALGRARGAELLCTMPAEPGLFDWYEKQLDLRCALRRERRELESRSGGAPVLLPAAEYGRRREALLEGLPHMALSDAGLLLEEANCLCFGGGLYALGEGLAAAYVHEGVTEVRELLGAPPESAAALGAHLGTARVRLWRPAPEGEPYLAFAPVGLPADTVWDLAFD